MQPSTDGIRQSTSPGPAPAHLSRDRGRVEAASGSPRVRRDGARALRHRPPRSPGMLNRVPLRLRPLTVEDEAEAMRAQAELAGDEVAFLLFRELSASWSEYLD